ncbi:uncharacterized protein BXZ73DRAFT_53102 [Epithele typhae]|uniref:uncharacterized protein n=1 Tax=Epithele typhae TaxID=378194 RepID=UPI0020074190|nr:uncharacterized protein BXZ73DRAFT_53102 [Epithele typhae]KAH9918244.1 hypothetical protein BXZ73DRAFT_53102 [Epithele typhae]
MPVPVPVFIKQPSHQVIKINHPSQPDSKSSVFQHLTNTLPLPPQGPPPSLASREEWISSLPSWRRNKPRRIWEDDYGLSQDLTQQGFQEGLTAADNASVIKGAHAQASIPPVRASTFEADFLSGNMYLAPEEMDDEMDGYPAMRDWRSDDDLSDFPQVQQKTYQRMSTDSPIAVAVDRTADSRTITRSLSAPGVAEAYARYERGAFSPVLEDYSPDVAENFSPEQAGDVEVGSSPIGPATPFADYVDNAFVEAQYVPALQRSRAAERNQSVSYPTHDGYHATCYQCQTCQGEQPVQQAPATESVVTPVATAAYKKLAAPLSEWIVGYVWKVCTTGMRLPPVYAQPGAFFKHYPSSPPSHLISSTHSMLLSTLLQPSAVFLALWYIVRLPVFFGPVGLGPEHVKEMRFRAELLGEAHLGADRDMIEAYAPFRLILLGCMLANKWLDDHTFSNKTWHTISNVPIRSLNRLEALALDIFQYDLSIAPLDWTDWLSDIMAYHQALSSPMFPQPISRPSTSPHIIVRQALETLVNAGTIDYAYSGNEVSGPPMPIFVGLEDQKKTDEDTYVDDVLEIDLDEDGPLREEYLPRRRTSTRSFNAHADPYAKGSERALPPPAKWSPAADEPILRDSTRGHGQYVAPQPVSHLGLPPPPPQYQPSVDMHHPSWPIGGYVMRQDPARAFPPPMYQAPHPAFDYGYGVPTVHPSHGRSHSLSYNQAMEQAPARLRSFSQTQFDHDVRVPEAQYVSPPAWGTYNRIGFPTSYDRPFGLSHRPSLMA